MQLLSLLGSQRSFLASVKKLRNEVTIVAGSCNSSHGAGSSRIPFRVPCAFAILCNPLQSFAILCNPLQSFALTHLGPPPSKVSRFGGRTATCRENRMSDAVGCCRMPWIKIRDWPSRAHRVPRLPLRFQAHLQRAWNLGLLRRQLCRSHLSKGPCSVAHLCHWPKAVCLAFKAQNQKGIAVAVEFSVC